MNNTFKVVDNRIILGRFGYSRKKQSVRRTELTEKFGKENWEISHLYDNKLLSREETLEHIENSYVEYFKNNKEILEWLVTYASNVYDSNPSNVDSGLDYTIQETQAVHLYDIAIRRALMKLDKVFKGKQLLEIRGEDSEGFILSAGQVPFYRPKMILKPQLKGWWNKDSIESYWQSNKILVVNFSQLERMSKQMIGVILRKDLRLGKGKFSAQTAHAIVSLLPERGKRWNFEQRPIEIWTVKNEMNLLSIYRQAQKLKINCSLIRDAGKTQIAPGTKTAVGLGPINEAIFEKIVSRFDASPSETNKKDYRSFKHIALTNI